MLSLTHLVFMLALTGMACYLKPSTRLAIACTIAIPQIYVSSLPLTVAQDWMLALLLAALLAPRSTPLHFPGLTALVGLVVAHLASASWSVDSYDAIYIATTLAGFVGILLTAVLAAPEIGAIRRALLWASPFVILQAALTVLFRLDQAREHTFQLSRLGELLVGPGARAMYTGSPNNTLDPEKAGGLFINGNTASMAMGAMAMTYFAIRHVRTDKPNPRTTRWFQVVGLASYVGVLFTGSKSGILLAVVIPLLAMITRFALTRGAGWMLAPVFPALVATVWVTAGAAHAQIADFLDRADHSLGQRQNFWSVARRLFSENPIYGLGHGGWVAQTTSEFGGVPPHNFVVAAWADCGLFGATCVLAFMLTVGIAGSRRAVSMAKPASCILALGGLSWIWIHGMGDNSSVFGTTHSAPFAAILVVLATSRSKSESESNWRESTETADRAQGRHSVADVGA